MATLDTPNSDFPDHHSLLPGDSVDFDLTAFSPAAAADAEEPTFAPDDAALDEAGAPPVAGLFDAAPAGTELPPVPETE